MNEKLNLVEILKECPKGTKLYSPLYGEVTFCYIDFYVKEYPIVVERNGGYIHFTLNGRLDFFIIEQECMLFPSKEVRTWNNFHPKKPKFDPKTLKPFDRVLVKRGYNKNYYWFADFITASPVTDADIRYCTMTSVNANMVIPYNDETKYLVGATEEAPEYYRYWED